MGVTGWHHINLAVRILCVRKGFQKGPVQLERLNGQGPWCVVIEICITRMGGMWGYRRARKGGMMEKIQIKVLGETEKCDRAEELVRDAVARAGVEADIEKINDTMEITGYCIFGTPAVIIDDEVKCVGRVPNRDDVRQWFGSE